MAESPEQKYERLKHVVQEHILRDYPNPDREGCPGDAAVRSVAERTELRKDAWWHHITHCSPCYTEFLTERQKLEAVGADRGLLSRRWVVFGGGAVAFATVGAVAFHLSQPDPVYRVFWDLGSQRTFRGLDREHMQGPTGPPLSAPAQRVVIELKVAAGQPDGLYDIAVWTSPRQPELFHATAVVASGRATFEADLRKLSAGVYTLGVRLASRQDWSYSQLQVT